jgi:hypothetical protein
MMLVFMIFFALVVFGLVIHSDVCLLIFFRDVAVSLVSGLTGRFGEKFDQVLLTIEVWTDLD